MTCIYKHIILIILLITILPHNTLADINILTQQSDTINIIDSHNNKQGWWRIYFSFEILKEEGNFINNKKQGIWISYYESGSKKAEITYNQGQAKGKATFFYKNGKIRECGNWQLDHWVGRYQYYYESGQLSYNWNYNEEGRREGEQIYFHENGNKMYEGEWNNGKTEGKLLVYNKEGLLIQEKNYAEGKITNTEEVEPAVSSMNEMANDNTNKDINDIPRLKFEGTGNHTIINDKGKIAAKGFFVKGSLFNGEKFNYNQKEQLISITYYKNGKKTETKLKSELHL